MIDRLIKLSPIIGSLIFISSIFKLTSYYNHFGINIINYIEFQEVITLFLDKVVLFLTVIYLLISLLFIFLYSLLKNTDIPTKEIIDYELKDSKISRNNRIAPFIIITICIFYSLMFFNILPYNQYGVLTISFFTLLTFVVWLSKKIKGNNYYVSPELRIFILSFCLVMSIELFINLEIKDTEQHKKSVRITMDDKTIDCNKNTKNLYIGKTTNYVFIKLHKTQEVKVIPVSSVKSFSFKSK